VSREELEHVAYQAAGVNLRFPCAGGTRDPPPSRRGRRKKTVVPSAIGTARVAVAP